MTDGDLEEVDQFSDVSCARLEAAAAVLISGIERHTAGVVALRGGSSEIGTVFDLNDAMKAAAKAWEMAVLDHTGTSVLGLDFMDDEDEDYDEDEDEEEVELIGAVSVVARWDLAVTNVSELISAGRAAHRRLQPDETEADAAVAIGDQAVGQALYAVCHEFGEPWFDLPGVQLAGGKRAYLQIDLDDLEDEDADEEALFDFVPVAPEGQVLYSESW